MRAVFLDRDGTIVEDKGYVTVPDMLEVLPGAARAIAALKGAGWKVFVVTNQAGVAKGLITEDELGVINLQLLAMLSVEGAAVDGIYWCPHHPDGTVPEYSVECGCRKPRAGLLEQAASEHGLDLSRCVMIGDAMRDIEAGKAVGAATVLVLTGHGAATAAQAHGADFVAKDLAAASEWVRARGA